MAALVEIAKMAIISLFSSIMAVFRSNMGYLGSNKAFLGDYGYFALICYMAHFGLFCCFLACFRAIEGAHKMAAKSMKSSPMGPEIDRFRGPWKS